MCFFYARIKNSKKKLSPLDAQPEARLHVDRGIQAVLGAGAGSRRRDDGEGAAGRRPVWLLGVVPGEPGHEPRGEDWRQVEIWP